MYEKLKEKSIYKFTLKSSKFNIFKDKATIEVVRRFMGLGKRMFLEYLIVEDEQHKEHFISTDCIEKIEEVNSF